MPVGRTTWRTPLSGKRFRNTLVEIHPLDLPGKAQTASAAGERGEVSADAAASKRWRETPDAGDNSDAGQSIHRGSGTARNS